MTVIDPLGRLRSADEFIEEIVTLRTDLDAANARLERWEAFRSSIKSIESRELPMYQVSGMMPPEDDNT
jgi:hypothetical protein